MIQLALLPLFVGICFCRVGKDKSVREAERRDTDEKQADRRKRKKNTIQNVEFHKKIRYVCEFCGLPKE